MAVQAQGQQGSRRTRRPGRSLERTGRLMVVPCRPLRRRERSRPDRAVDRAQWGLGQGAEREHPARRQLGLAVYQAVLLRVRMPERRVHPHPSKVALELRRV